MKQLMEALSLMREDVDPGEAGGNLTEEGALEKLARIGGQAGTIFTALEDLELKVPEGMREALAGMRVQSKSLFDLIMNYVFDDDDEDIAYQSYDDVEE